MAKSFTAGERRGMIALLLVLAIIISAIYFTNRSSSTTPLAVDSSAIEIRQSILNDTITLQKRTKQKRTQKHKKQSQQAPSRDPLSQPVPHDIK